MKPNLTRILFTFPLLIVVLVISTITNAIPPLQVHLTPTRHQSHNEVTKHNNNYAHSNGSQQQLLSDIDVSNRNIVPRFRLPGHVIPIHYNVKIRPVLLANDPDGATLFTCPGEVTITVECVQAGTNVITMHAAELDIELDTITVIDAETPTEQFTITATRFNTSESVQSFEIELDRQLTVGRQYNVFIKFISQIADPATRMNGIYRSSYKFINNDGEEETRVVATTHFSRTRAVRKTFPSFDEPNQKATFEFVIGKTEPYHTLSNMNLDRTEPGTGNLEDWSWDYYHKTPKMPVTILAFVISDFGDVVADPNLFDPTKPVKVWAPPPMLRDDSAVYAAETVAKVLKHFEDLFGIKYEFPKMDSVAMPDFAAGAMENWGLNIYRTPNLLWYPEESLMSLKFSIGSVIAHEVAHQWWGNLVTHAWWNDWWLTEGFASYFEYVGFAAADTNSEFAVPNRIVCDDMQTAMDFDSGPTSVPIHGPHYEEFVENPSAINYQKGGSLIRMMQGFLTQEPFINALKYYLNKRSHEAVHQDALFTDLDEYLTQADQMPSNSKTMTEILETWTLQASYPLVRVSMATGSSIFVSQEKFRKYVVPTTTTAAASAGNQAVEDKKRALNDNDLWHVPIGYVSGSAPNFDEANLIPKFWIDKTVALMRHSPLDTSTWLVLNGDARGYYRVLYDDHFESLLQAQLATDLEVISPASRSQLVDDYFALAYERYINVERTLNMTVFLKDEVDYVVWVPAFRHLRKCSLLFPSLPTTDSSFTEFQTYMSQALQNVINYVDEDLMQDQPMRTILKVPVLDWACNSGHAGCITNATDLVTEWMADPPNNPIAVDIRASVYCTAVAHDLTSDTWDFMLEQYKIANNVGFLNALACTNDGALLESILTQSIANGTDIPQSAAVTAIQRVALNSAGRKLVIQFLKEKLVEIIEHTGGNPVVISSIVGTLATNVVTESEKSELEELITTHQDILAPQLSTLNGHLVTIASNINWFENVGVRMSTWFKNYNQNP